MTASLPSPSSRAPASSRLWVRVLALTLLLAPVLATIGLSAFVWTVGQFNQTAPAPAAAADAVVVFTGEPRRIEAALHALAGGVGRRLLITGTELSAGTDTAATMTNVRRDYAALFACCVDLDARPQTTRENARDAAEWVRRHGFASLALVTADDHLPRARLELACARPGLTILPLPMVTGRASLAVLWREPGALRHVVDEALKFTLAWVRVQTGACPPALPREVGAHSRPHVWSAKRDPVAVDG